MLGISKWFIIALILAIIVGIGTHNFVNFLIIIGVYAIGKIIFNILT